MNDDSVRELLRELAATDALAEASDKVEIQLRKVVRAHRRKRTLRRTSLWTASAAAILLLFVFMIRSKPAVQTVASSATGRTPIAVEEEAGAVPAAVARKAPDTEIPERAVRVQPREVVTEFFPLMDVAPPLQRGKIMRIELPSAAMEIVGLPVRQEHRNDPVQADVVIGEEGLPRAIRFVKLEGN